MLHKVRPSTGQQAAKEDGKGDHYARYCCRMRRCVCMRELLQEENAIGRNSSTRIVYLVSSLLLLVLRRSALGTSPSKKKYLFTLLCSLPLLHLLVLVVQPSVALVKQRFVLIGRYRADGSEELGTTSHRPTAARVQIVAIVV